MTKPVASSPPTRKFTAHVLPLGVSVAVGLSLSFWPYLMWWSKLHQWVFVADPDNLLYLQMAAQPYYTAISYVADPVSPNHSTLFSWLFLVPPAKLIRALGASPFRINDVWHLWSAVGIAAVLYFLFYRYLEREWLAAGCAVFVMADAGCLVAQPLIAQAAALTRLFANHPGDLLTQWPPVFLQQWRIVDPGLGLPFLFLQILALARARRNPTRQRIAFSGLTFGLLFYVYFYFWTAAAGALIIACLLDARYRRVYAHSLWIGCLLGAPLVASNLGVRYLGAPDALSRVSYFLPVSRLSFFLLPKFALFGCAVTAAWIWKNGRLDAVYLWSLGVSGIILSNNHVVTGLDLRAGHWRMVWGCVLEILLVIAAVDVTANRGVWRTRQFKAFGVAFICLYVVASLYLVRLDTLDNKFAVKSLEQYARFSIAQSDRPRLCPGSVVAGDEAFCDFSVVAEGQRPLSGYAATMSLWVGDSDWETRMALDSYLSGTDSGAFKTWAQNFSANFQWGPWNAGSQPRSDLFAGLMTAYAEVSTAPARSISHYQVRYVAIPPGNTPPLYLQTNWKRLSNGPVWQLWERPAAPSFTARLAHRMRSRPDHPGVGRNAAGET